ncbi:MAG: pitrilysin family protein [Candidatus Omnitrophota bacterium]
MYKISVLDSGVKIVTYTDSRVSSEAVGVWIGAGGRYESTPENGVSHFLEHLVFKGTKNRTYRQIKESIEGFGGILNGFTSDELTCFLAKVLSGQVATAVDVLMDLTFNSLIKTSDIQKERLVVYEEIKMYSDLPRHLAYDGLMQLLWPDHPLGRNIAGTVETLKEMTRKDILNYKETHYSPKNILIAACGNVAHDVIVKNAEKFITKNRLNKACCEKPVYQLSQAFKNESKTSFIIKNIEQTHCCLGVRAPDRKSSLRHALTLLNIILGANMSSRLFNEVRERKGLAYDIGTGIKRLSDDGAFIVHAGVVNEKVKETLTVIFKELKKIVRTLADKDEFTRAKLYYIGQLTMGIEDTSEHMSYIGETLLCEGNVKKIKEVIKEIEKVKVEDIRKVAEMIFKRENLTLSIVGPLQKGQDEQLKQLMQTF